MTERLPIGSGGNEATKDVARQEGEEKYNGPESLQELYRDKLTHGQVAALIKVVISDPTARALFYENFKDKDILKSSGADPEKFSSRVSALMISMMRDTSLRGLLMEAVLTDMREESEERESAAVESQKERTDKKRELETSTYNRAVIGGGVHATIFNNALARTNVKSKNLTIEGSDVISRNFVTKQFVSINTRNQPHTGEIPNEEVKRGNMNYFGKEAPVQVPFIEPELYPSADTMAEVATVNQYLSGSETLFTSRVDRVVFPEDDPGSARWPARYKILLKNGGVRFSDEVILSTGLGEAEYPSQFDEESVRIAKRDSLEAQKEREEDPDMPPGIMTYEDAAEFFTESLTPVRHFAGKKVDVVGGSDGAATIIEELLRYAKRKSYKKDVAQVGTPAKMYWGGQKIKDSRQYRNLLANERYLMLASEMPLSGEDLDKYDEDTRKQLEKNLEPIEGHLAQIRDSDDPEKGRYRVTYSMPDKSVQEHYTDFVILAAGYKNKIASLFGKKDNPFDNPDEAEVVKGELNGIPVPVAVKIKGQAVYAIGPASIGRVLKEGELELAGLSGVPANRYLQRVAIATFGPRSEKLGEILGAEEVRTLPRFEPKKEPLEIKVAGPNSEKVELEGTKERPQGDRSLDEVRLKVLVGKFFGECKIKGSLPQLSIQFEKGSKDNSAFMSFYPDIDERQKLAGFLEGAKVQNLLADSLKGGRWKLIMDIPFDKNGDARIPEINIRKEPVKK